MEEFRKHKKLEKVGYANAVVSVLIFLIFVRSISILFIYHDFYGKYDGQGPENVTITLKVMCNEEEGFCELKKVLYEQSDDSLLPVSFLFFLQRGLNYPVFVTIYSLRKNEHTTMRSYIEITEPPPPMFS